MYFLNVEWISWDSLFMYCWWCSLFQRWGLFLLKKWNYYIVKVTKLKQKQLLLFFLKLLSKGESCSNFKDYKSVTRSSTLYRPAFELVQQLIMPIRFYIIDSPPIFRRGNRIKLCSSFSVQGTQKRCRVVITIS